MYVYPHGGVFELDGFGMGVSEAIFVHDPIGFDTSWGFSFVKDEGFLNTNGVLSRGRQ